MDQRLGAPGAAPYQCAACSQAAAAWPAPMGRTARLRARAQACARSRIARLRATAEDPGLTLPHWHTPPPLHRTAGTRREGGRVRVAVVDSATPPGRSPAVAAAQVAVEYGARRRAEQAPSPPCGSAAADSPGRWLVGAAQHRAAGSVSPLRATCISNVAAERVRERVWGTLPHGRAARAPGALITYQHFRFNTY